MKYWRSIIYFFISILLFSGINAYGQTAYIPPEKPKLVVSIVLEQFRYDYIDKNWDNFSEGGFKRLIN